MQPQVVILGIDGASHRVVSDLLRRGRLPNFERAIGEGTFGPLETVFPPHTAPGWTSMFTGVEPGRHGIYQFWDTQERDYGVRSIGSADFRREPLWETLSRHGRSVGVVNVPMTHPPKRLPGGYMITWPLSPTIHYTEPRSLLKELRANGLHFHSDLVTMYRGQEDYFEQAMDCMKARTATLRYLLAEWPTDVVISVYTEVDRVSHYYWGRGEAPDTRVEEIYRAMDDTLGEIREVLAPETLLLVTSDHGFGVCRKNLYVNALLEQEGLLAVRFRAEGSEGTTAFRLDVAESDGSLDWFESKRTYRKHIDWEKTRAYMPTPGCFGINVNLRGRQARGIVGPGEREGVADEIRAALGRLDDDGMGPPLDLLPREQVYSGSETHLAPDFILVPGSWDIMPHPLLNDELWGPPTQPAIHRMDGIFLATGAALEAKREASLKIYDVYPIVLNHLGLPCQRGLDSYRALDASTRPRYEAEVPYAADASGSLSPEEAALMDRHLHDLGYM